MSFYGKGSYPLPPPGWHFEMRFTASQLPLNKPYFFNASNAYCEQVGVNLHFGPSMGDTPYWYSFINPIKG